MLNRKAVKITANTHISYPDNEHRSHSVRIKNTLKTTYFIDKSITIFLISTELFPKKRVFLQTRIYTSYEHETSTTIITVLDSQCLFTTP